ncbi:MAG: YfiR family protein, partial [Myxococcota bacterium]
MRRRGASALLLLVATALLAAAASAGPRGEYEVKAAFLVNFASLVEWPEAAFGEDGDLKVGVFGEEAVVDEICCLLDGRRVGSRLVRARRLDSLQQ